MTGASRGSSHGCRVNHGECRECSPAVKQLHPALALCLISDKISRENGQLLCYNISHFTVIDSEEINFDSLVVTDVVTVT